MPTVSTVEKTTSARFAAAGATRGRSRSRRRTLRQPRAPRFSAAPGDRAQRGGARSLEVVPYRVAALRELIHPEERVARSGARLELERRASLRRVAEEVEDGGHRIPPVR